MAGRKSKMRKRIGSAKPQDKPVNMPSGELRDFVAEDEKSADLEPGLHRV